MEERRILVADAGGTSTQWCLFSTRGELLQELSTDGINAVVSTDEAINQVLWKACELIGAAHDIFFYGAGCATREACNRVESRLSLYNMMARINVASDLLGAARAIFGNTPGIACILGTGSNSCAYDGTAIVHNVSPLGYILGDEGSGAALGKRLVRAVLRNEVNHPEVIKAVATKVGGELSQIIAKVYRLPGANNFLASLAPILSEYRHMHEINALIHEEFDSFFKQCVSRYNVQEYKRIGFVGSLASAFEIELLDKVSEAALISAGILKSPMQGLVKYHADLCS